MFQRECYSLLSNTKDLEDHDLGVVRPVGVLGRGTGLAVQSRLPPRPRLRWAVPSAGGARVPVLPGLDGSFCWLRGGGGSCVCAPRPAAPRRPPEPGARAPARGSPRRRGRRLRAAQQWPCAGWGPRCCCCRC